MAMNKLNNYLILFVLIILVVFFSIMKPNTFFTADNFFTIMRQVSMMGISAVGMTFVLLVGGLDLSVGTMQGLVGILLASFMVDYSVAPPLAVIFVLLIGMGVGLVNGLIVTRLRVNPFIATLSMMQIVKGFAFLYSNAFPIFGFNPSFQFLGQGYVFQLIPIPVVIMAGAFAIGWILLSKTYLGRSFYAVGGNEESSRLSGLNVNRVKMIAYMCSGLTAAVAAVILCSRLNSGQPNAGAGFEFDVITAVILGRVSLSGGEGKLSNVLIGVLIIGVLSNGMIIMNISEYLQWVIKGLVLIAAVAIDGIEKKAPKALIN
jgi:ribose transport system permease protein